MTTHTQLRAEYEKALDTFSIRQVLRTRSTSIYRDIFSVLEPTASNSEPALGSEAMLRQQHFRDFVNKQVKRVEEDLSNFLLTDLQMNLSMLIDITANLYGTRANLVNELRDLILRCESDARWIRFNAQKQAVEIALIKARFLDTDNMWYLLTPIEYAEKHFKFPFPKHLEPANCDARSTKLLILMCSEEREYLIWHVAEMQKIVGILKLDLQVLAQPASLAHA